MTLVNNSVVVRTIFFLIPLLIVTAPLMRHLPRETYGVLRRARQSLVR
jgi:hypothetical protein